MFGLFVRHAQAGCTEYQITGKLKLGSLGMVTLEIHPETNQSMEILVRGLKPHDVLKYRDLIVTAVAVSTEAKIQPGGLLQVTSAVAVGASAVALQRPLKILRTVPCLK